MSLISLGVIAFLLFVIYDINSIIFKNPILKYLFFIGLLLLFFSTVGLVFGACQNETINYFRISIYGFLSIVMLCFLLYSLFFALPFKETYLDDSKSVCQTGVYALCRHPGLLFFTGFYFFLWLAFDSEQLFLAGLIFSLCNLIYVIFQDRWTFIRYFDDYKIYQKNTPFLIPSLDSLKRCLKTFRQEME
jgi:protein-S-isoprenylcysteine O-methyltransferase Ste14